MEIKRLDYIDLARAVAVVSVIAYHFLRIDEMWGLGTFINTYFLSVFFVISGLLLHPKPEIKWIIKKIKRLLLPLVSFSVIYIPILIINNEAPAGSVIHDIFWSESKGGYWFVYTLFASILLIWLIHYLVETLHLHKWSYWAFLILPWLIACGMSIMLPQRISYLLSIPSFRRYYPFILLGIIGQKEYIRQIIRKTSTYVVITIIYILLVALSLLKFQEIDSALSFLVWITTNIFGCLFLIETCWRACRHIQLHSVTKWLSQDSLGIYLGQFIIRRISYNSFMALPISPYISFLPYTLFLLITSLVLTRILRTNTITTKLFLGQ